MKQYRTVNNLVGWITFLIATTVYCLTIEPTASFWDCPEFITTGYKLEVGHPPGAPFFMLVANLFPQFAADATLGRWRGLPARDRAALPALPPRQSLPHAVGPHRS